MMTDELTKVRDRIDRDTRVMRALDYARAGAAGDAGREEWAASRGELVDLRARERQMMAVEQPATAEGQLTELWEAEKVLEKVRGIVEEWDKSKHRSAGADSWGSMAQIQAALMP